MFEQVELFIFHIALLVVFAAWLAKHVWHEVEPLVRLVKGGNRRKRFEVLPDPQVEKPRVDS